jgi:hypothetical protein
MRRFRYTLIAICLVLLFLGVTDLRTWISNPSPQSVSIADIEQDGAPREWLHITNGHQDLDRAISTSGSVELEALLIPLLLHPDQEKISVLIESRSEHLLRLFKEYHFFTDTVPEKQEFRRKYADAFKGQKDVTGMMVSGLIVRSNQQKLLDLAKQTGMNVSDNVIFISEGKEPGKWRGIFFTVVGLLGLFRVFTTKKQKEKPVNTSEDNS